MFQHEFVIQHVNREKCLLGFDWRGYHFLHGPDFCVFQLLGRQEVFVHDGFGLFGFPGIRHASSHLMHVAFLEFKALLGIEATEFKLGLEII